MLKEEDKHKLKRRCVIVDREREKSLTRYGLERIDRYRFTI
jgi:hypothetical protein